MTFAKLLDAGALRDDDAEKDHWDGHECCDCEIHGSNALNISVDTVSIDAKREERLNCAGDERNKHNDDRCIINLKC